MKKLGLVSIWLKYEIPEGEDEQEFLENVELPSNYVTDTFEIMKVVEGEEVNNY